MDFPQNRCPRRGRGGPGEARRPIPRRIARCAASSGSTLPVCRATCSGASIRTVRASLLVKPAMPKCPKAGRRWQLRRRAAARGLRTLPIPVVPWCPTPSTGQQRRGPQAGRLGEWQPPKPDKNCVVQMRTRIDPARRPREHAPRPSLQFRCDPANHTVLCDVAGMNPGR